MTAPTEAEIREALENRANHPRDDYARDTSWLDYLSDGLRHASYGPWANARDPEFTTPEDPILGAMLDAAVQRAAARCMEIAIEELTVAGLAYARAYPDAPRAVREPVSA